MINLLPPQAKASYRYARRNVSLRSWLIALSLVLVGVGALVTFGLLDLQQQVNSYHHQVADAKATLDKDKLTETEQKVKDISSSLRLATQVLGSEVLFSKLITQIGAAMPPGSILAGLNINRTTGGLDLNANAKDYSTASQVQVNLSSSANKIFAKADIVTISCTTPKEQDKAVVYPCTVTLRALFNGNNQFLFVNQGAKS
ncbi:MAG: hypothetical protein QFB87_01400 [Patescibacteria group bacterium]|nr:hypothetical protein [Patescibacteria group bacterium]